MNAALKLHTGTDLPLRELVPWSPDVGHAAAQRRKEEEESREQKMGLYRRVIEPAAAAGSRVSAWKPPCAKPNLEDEDHVAAVKRPLCVELAARDSIRFCLVLSARIGRCSSASSAKALGSGSISTAMHRDVSDVKLASLEKEAQGHAPSGI